MQREKKAEKKLFQNNSLCEPKTMIIDLSLSFSSWARVTEFCTPILVRRPNKPTRF